MKIFSMLRSSFIKTQVLFYLIPLLTLIPGIWAPFFSRSVLAQTGDTVNESGSNPAARQSQFLPLISRRPVASNYPVLLGMYSQGGPGQQYTMDHEFHPIDAWAGKAMSIAGTFIDFEVPNPDFNVASQLTTIWNNGYTPFVNIETTHTAYQVASGQIDTAIRAFAHGYALYANGGGGRMAYLAPLQEMNSCSSNGCWTSYGGDPANYKLAFWHIQSIFEDEGVPASRVRWVFAPNGWSDPYHDDPFEAYYPGNDSVDVVGFSAYNFGYFPPNHNWEWPDEVFNGPLAPPQGQYLDRMRAMAPGKPIFITQSGTTAYYVGGVPSVNKKNQWLRDSYTFLATYPDVKAIIYLNKVNAQGIDWPFFVPGDPSRQYTGYVEGITHPNIAYVSPQDLMNGVMVEQP